MESLENYPVEFIDDMPLKINREAVGRTFKKMSKSTTTTPEVKASKKYAKTRGEHSKDLIIAILVSGIIAFIGGMTFQARQQSAIDTAVKSVAPVVSAEAPVKK